jgi:hypothetical protein
MPANLRGLRKLGEREISSHHEAHEGHEVRKLLLKFSLSFVILVPFVVKIVTRFWLRPLNSNFENVSNAMVLS